MAVEAGLCQQFLSKLTGVWTTEAARGQFPTMTNFVFGAELTVAPQAVKTKRPAMVTQLVSWPVGKRGVMGMHSEQGFLRCGAGAGGDELEWFITHNFGATEIVKGKVAPAPEVGSGALRAVLISHYDETNPALSGLNGMSVTTATKRELILDPTKEELTDIFSMATIDVPTITEHLRVPYHKLHKGPPVPPY